MKLCANDNGTPSSITTPSFYQATLTFEPRPYSARIVSFITGHTAGDIWPKPKTDSAQTGIIRSLIIWNRFLATMAVSSVCDSCLYLPTVLPFQHPVLSESTALAGQSSLFRLRRRLETPLEQEMLSSMASRGIVVGGSCRLTWCLVGTGDEERFRLNCTLHDDSTCRREREREGLNGECMFFSYVLKNVDMVRFLSPPSNP